MKSTEEGSSDDTSYIMDDEEIRLCFIRKINDVVAKMTLQDLDKILGIIEIIKE